jgi:hypothetical protein
VKGRRPRPLDDGGLWRRIAAAHGAPQPRSCTRAIVCRAGVDDGGVLRVRALLAISLLLTAITGSGAATPSRPASTVASNGPLLGIIHSSRTAKLARLNPLTLAPTSVRTVALGRNTGAWALSPNGRELAIGVDRALGVRFVDIRATNRIADVRTRNGDILALAWLTPRRVVGLDRAGEFVIDPVKRRQIAFRAEQGSLSAWIRTRSRLVLLLGPPPDGIAVAPVANGVFGGAIGPTRLVTIDAAGRRRSVLLDRIRSGGSYDNGRPPEAWIPGIAVDPSGNRAYVVGGGAPVAEVDLRTLAVSYHDVRPAKSFLGRVLDWFVPDAAAKGPIAGPVRQVVLIADGKLAIAGVDVDVVARQFGIDVTTTPYGLKIVDTRTWTARTLDDRATGLATAPNELLAFAGSFDEQYGPTGGIGLVGFTSSGVKLFHEFGDAPIFWVKTVRSTAYLAPQGRIVGVDVASGKVVRTLRGALPEIIR